MKLIIGLGNPGDRYKNNRHNAGHMFIDFVQGEALHMASARPPLMKTDIFMNDSGRFVAEKFNFYKVTLDDLYVVHDDLDLPLGEYKIQKGVGPKVHNGVNSIEKILGRDFWRIRIGVDARPTPPSASRAKGEDYVLQDFSKDELVILHEVFDAILKDRPFQN